MPTPPPDCHGAGRVDSHGPISTGSAAHRAALRAIPAAQHTAAACPARLARRGIARTTANLAFFHDADMRPLLRRASVRLRQRHLRSVQTAKQSARARRAGRGRAAARPRTRRGVRRRRLGAMGCCPRRATLVRYDSGQQWTPARAERLRHRARRGASATSWRRPLGRRVSGAGATMEGGERSTRAPCNALPAREAQTGRRPLVLLDVARRSGRRTQCALRPPAARRPHANGGRHPDRVRALPEPRRRCDDRRAARAAAAGAGRVAPPATAVTHVGPGGRIRAPPTEWEIVSFDTAAVDVAAHSAAAERAVPSGCWLPTPTTTSASSLPVQCPSTARWRSSCTPGSTLRGAPGKVLFFIDARDVLCVGAPPTSSPLSRTEQDDRLPRSSAACIPAEASVAVRPLPEPPPEQRPTSDPDLLDCDFTCAPSKAFKFLNSGVVVGYAGALATFYGEVLATLS